MARCQNFDSQVFTCRIKIDCNRALRLAYNFNRAIQNSTRSTSLSL